MGEAYRAKVFRSGNSVALRLPKALGLTEGTEMLVRAEGAQFVMEPVDVPPATIRGDWIGSMKWLEPLTRAERDFAPRALDWSGAELKRERDG